MAQPSKEKKGGPQTIFWWLMWIALTIGSFFVASAIWTPVVARQFGSVQKDRAAIAWVAAVFGTWMLFLIPLIVLMYHEVDKAYEDARIAREKAALRFKSIDVDRAKRIISPEVCAPLKELPETIAGGHLVGLRLKDGTVIEHAFVAHQSELLGLYNFDALDFEGRDIAEITPVDPEKVPVLLTANWLRLDGVSPPQD